MPVDVTMPKLGLTMTTGTISRWLKAAGESVREGEPLLEVSTDKINYEVESPSTGILARAIGKAGEEYACGAVIGVIARAGDGEPAASRVAAIAASGNGDGARIVASPAARRLARERAIPLAGLSGTGPRGRITMADVVAAQGAPAPPARPSHASGASVPPERRAIFRKMTDVATIPLAQVETRVRVDATRSLLDRGGSGWAAFAVVASARVLRAHPVLRTSAVDGRPMEAIDIGLAVDTPHGLIVPVIRGADRRTLAETHAEIVRLATAARAGKLAPDDAGGACFSISNVGPQGVERVSPLVDPPQTAILGVGAATRRPVVEGDAVVPGWVVDLIVAFDHRFIDGAPAARFLAGLAAAFADPATLL